MVCSALVTAAGWQRPAHIPPEDRGFRYGMHVFETIFRRAGVWQDWDLHVASLRLHGESVGFRATSQQWGMLEDPPTEVPESCRARLFWTAGAGGLLEPPGEGLLLFTAEALEEKHLGSPRDLRVGYADTPVCAGPGVAKSGNYWTRLNLLQAAHAAGFDEAVVFNPQGHWLGFCCGNGFALVEGQWLTPAWQTGTRRGVTRQKALAAFPEIREALLGMEELRRATALVFASSRTGLCPVASLAGRALERWLPGNFPHKHCA